MFDGALMVVVGVFITLIGFRKIDMVRSQAGFDAEAWHAKHGRRMRVIGPLVIAAGIALAVWGVYA